MLVNIEEKKTKYIYFPVMSTVTIKPNVLMIVWESITNVEFRSNLRHRIVMNTNYLTIFEG